MDPFGRRGKTDPGGVHPAVPISRILLSFALLLAACSPVEIKTRNGVYHTVRKGETLWRVCEQYQVNLTSVCMFNRIEDPESIQAGQRLFLPGVEESRRVPPAAGTWKGRPAPGDESSGAREDPASSSGTSPAPEFIWPVRGKIASRFGTRNGRRHDGIDISVPWGTPVVAAEAGKVVYSDDGIQGYGNLIILQHRREFSTVYAHNSRNIVSVDATVQKGQTIGYVGNTGRSRGDHLHFEIRRRVKPVDPLKYLPPL